jgi:hypothetical protein
MALIFRPISIALERMETILATAETDSILMVDVNYFFVLYGTEEEAW